MSYDVYRDDDGKPVIITPQQMRAIWHAITVQQSLASSDAPTHLLAKSRLLGRMLIDGRPPFDTPPPLAGGGPDYKSLEPDLHHFYFDGEATP